MSSSGGSSSDQPGSDSSSGPGPATATISSFEIFPFSQSLAAKKIVPRSSPARLIRQATISHGTRGPNSARSAGHGPTRTRRKAAPRRNWGASATLPRIMWTAAPQMMFATSPIESWRISGTSPVLMTSLSCSGPISEKAPPE